MTLELSPEGLRRIRGRNLPWTRVSKAGHDRHILLWEIDRLRGEVDRLERRVAMFEKIAEFWQRSTWDSNVELSDIRRAIRALRDSWSAFRGHPLAGPISDDLDRLVRRSAPVDVDDGLTETEREGMADDYAAREGSRHVVGDDPDEALARTHPRLRRRSPDRHLRRRRVDLRGDPAHLDRGGGAMSDHETAFRLLNDIELDPVARVNEQVVAEIIELFVEHDLLVTPRHDARVLRDAADAMDDTDDPDAIYVNNGDIDAWLRARADRIEGGGEQS